MRPSLLRSLSQPQSQLSPAESKTILSWLQHFKLSGGLTPPRHADCYELSYSRSSGPGGQNVNKLATKATVRFDLAKASTWLPEHVQRGLATSSFYAHSTHSLVLSSMRHRTQPANAQDCLEKLEDVIVQTASKGLQGETSQSQKDRVRGLIQADKARTKQHNQRRGDVKSGRSSKRNAFD